MKVDKGNRISTPHGRGRVIEIDWLSEQIMVLIDGADWVSNYNFSEIEDMYVTSDDVINMGELDFG